VIARVWEERDALGVLTSRAVREDYAGSVLGVAWAVAFPVALAAIYWLVFVRIVGAAAPEGYGLFLLAGLVPWFGWQQMLGGSLAAVRDARSWFVHVRLTPETLVASKLLAALGFVLAATAALIVGVALFGADPLPWTWPLVPLAVVGASLALWPWCGVLALGNGFLRDVGPVARLGLVLWFFATPIVYPPGAVPDAWQPLVWLNPLAHLVGCYRAGVLGDGSIAVSLLGLAVTGGAMYAVGAHVLGALRREIEDLV